MAVCSFNRLDQSPHPLAAFALASGCLIRTLSQRLADNKQGNETRATGLVASSTTDDDKTL
ncbi:hypothetical protein C2E31_05660 [Rhodopirellula baltica]|nr:hypothetical protein C2E31_05660 [Rhodopirellula baltica]